MASKGQKTATGLSMLVKTTRRVEALVMRKAIHACILPILTFGTPAWWPCWIQTNCEGRTIQNGMESKCKKLHKAQNIAIRAILPIWKTVSTAVIQKKVAIPPIHHRLDYLYKLAALGLHKLEVQHPLRIQTKWAYTTANPSRLKRIAQKCPNKVEYIDSSQDLELWEKYLFGSDSCLAATSDTSNKDKAAIKFNNWLNSQNPLDIIVYTHGSQEVDQNNTPTEIGAGWVLNWVGSWHKKQGISLGKTKEVYDAEEIAMLEGLQQALKSPMARVVPGIHICFDSIGVARNTGGVPKSSSQKVFGQFRNLAES